MCKQEEEEEEKEEAILTVVLVGKPPVDMTLRCCTTLSKAVLLLVLVPIVEGGGTRYAHAVAGHDHKATTAQKHINTAVAACGVRCMMTMKRWLLAWSLSRGCACKSERRGESCMDQQ